MPRKAILRDTIRELFARTGNECAFPGCTHPLLDDSGPFVALICQISAAEPGGPRHDPSMSDDERRNPSNLIVLCYRHHKITDDEKKYPAFAIKEMKKAHESQFSTKRLVLSNYQLDEIVAEQSLYWNHLEKLNQERIRYLEIATEIQGPRNLFSRMRQMREHINGIEMHLDDATPRHRNLSQEIIEFMRVMGYDVCRLEEFPYHKNAFWNFNWNLDSYSLPNTITYMRTRLLEMEIILLEERAKTGTLSDSERSRIQEAREKLLEIATNDYIVD